MKGIIILCVVVTVVIGRRQEDEPSAPGGPPSRNPGRHPGERPPGHPRPGSDRGPRPGSEPGSERGPRSGQDQLPDVEIEYETRPVAHPGPRPHPRPGYPYPQPGHGHPHPGHGPRPGHGNRPQGHGPIRRREDCRRIAQLLYNGYETAEKLPREVLERSLGLGANFTRTDLTKLICSMSTAETLQQIADKLPLSLEQVKRYVTETRAGLITRGGYVGRYRYPMIRFETGMWAKAHGFRSNDTKISNHVTLQNFTRFMLAMETKFGSSWVSALLDLPNDEIVIEDMRQFARDLYESADAEECSDSTDLPEGQCDTLLQIFGWQTKFVVESWGKEQVNFRLIELLGRNGLFDME